MFATNHFYIQPVGSKNFYITDYNQSLLYSASRFQNINTQMIWTNEFIPGWSIPTNYFYLISNNHFSIFPVDSTKLYLNVLNQPLLYKARRLKKITLQNATNHVNTRPVDPKKKIHSWLEPSSLIICRLIKKSSTLPIHPNHFYTMPVE